jgi:outer membrane protein
MKKIKSALYIYFFILFSVSHVSASELPVSKIAVVDVQAVLDSSIAVKFLRESIDKIGENLHNELSAKELSLKNTEAELVKKRGILKQEQFDKEVEVFYKQVSEAQSDMQKKKAKLEQAHADAIGYVHSATIKIIDEIAKERGFNIALPASQVLYYNEALNITSDVTNKLNQIVKTVELKY